MALPHSFQPIEDPQPCDQLLTVVLQYQETYWAWSLEIDSERRAALRDALHQCHEELWQLLADPLLKVAHGWLRCGSAQDMRRCPTSYPDIEDVLHSLAMSLYFHVVEALPQLRVDRNKNLLACLKTIAKRGMFDENLHIYSEAPRQSNTPPANHEIAPGTRSAQMWPAAKQSDVHRRDDSIEADLVDPHSLDFEHQLAVALDHHACCQAVWAFWQTLAHVDQQIVQLRWNQQPPVPYEAIATQFGPGWTSTTVRQRYCRVMQRTRVYLQKQGFDGGVSEDKTVADF